MAKKSRIADETETELDTELDNGAAEIPPGGSAGNTGQHPVDTEQLETAQEKHTREAREEHAKPEHEEHAKPKKRKDE
jgi:hypothetical protein